MEFEKICEVVAEQMGIDRASIKPETTFAKDLNADSLDVIQIISTLEEIFGMQFSDEEAVGIKTVGDAAEFVRKARNP